jgi:hypothetical protein
LIFLVATYPIYPVIIEERRISVGDDFFDLLLCRNFFAVSEPAKIENANPIRTSGAS